MQTIKENLREVRQLQEQLEAELEDIRGYDIAEVEKILISNVATEITRTISKICGGGICGEGGNIEEKIGKNPFITHGSDGQTWFCPSQKRIYDILKLKTDWVSVAELRGEYSVLYPAENPNTFNNIYTTLKKLEGKGLIKMHPRLTPHRWKVDNYTSY